MRLRGRRRPAPEEDIDQMVLITATKRFVKRAARFTADTGASLVEYTLLVALIAAVAIGAVTFIGNSSKDTLCNAGKDMGAQPAGVVTGSGEVLGDDCSPADAP